MNIFRLRKYISIVIISVFSTTLTPKILASTNASTINVLMPAPFADSTAELVKQFNNNPKNKDRIEITVTRGPLETESVSDLAISSLLLGDSPFDIILIDVTWLPKYAAAGWLSPIDKWIDKKEWNALAKGAQLGNTFQGETYRWPLVADMGLLYWRKDLMQKPPRTPNELIQISKRLQSEGKVTYGYVWQGRQYEGLSCVFLEVINAFGGNWLVNKTEVGIAKDQGLNAARWLFELIESGVSPKAVTNFTEVESLQAFESGDAAFMRNWPYAWAELQKETSTVKGKVGVTKMVAQRNKYPIATLGSWGFSILKSSSHQKESSEVIKFLTSSHSQRELLINYGYTPTNKELFKDKELIKTTPILPILDEALDIAMPRPQTPLYAQISDVLQRELSAILTGKKEVEEAMDLAQKNSQKILLSAGEIQ